MSLNLSFPMLDSLKVRIWIRYFRFDFLVVNSDDFLHLFDFLQQLFPFAHSRPHYRANSALREVPNRDGPFPCILLWTLLAYGF